jgi:hypothetical protein
MRVRQANGDFSPISATQRSKFACPLAYRAPRSGIPRGIKVLFGMPLRQTTGFVVSLLGLAGLD